MISEQADVAPSAIVPTTAKVWQHAQVRERAVLGENVIIGCGAYIGIGVAVGANSKVQNYAQIFEPAVLEAGVFIGPGAILTNDHFPRAVNPDGGQKTSDQWEALGVTVGHGASIGAGAICVAPIGIGPWAMVAAGSVVTKDVLPYSLMIGVPARRVAWVGKTGAKLVPHESNSHIFVCPETNDLFHERAGMLVEVTT